MGFLKKILDDLEQKGMFEKKYVLLEKKRYKREICKN
jgi:hypothetical protein